MRATPLFILFCIFLTLKLTGHVDWSWWGVTVPIWLPALLAGIAAAVYYGLTTPRDREIDKLARKMRRR